MVKIENLSLKNNEHVKLIKSTEELVEIYLKDSQKDKFSCLSDNPDCSLELARDIGFALALHAEYQAQSNNHKKAEQLLQSGLKLALALANNPTDTAVHLLIGLAIGNANLEVIEDNKNLSVKAKEYTIPLEVVKRSLIDDYLLFKSGVMGDQAPRTTYWMQSNRTVNEMADFTRGAIELSTTACEQTIDANNLTKLETIAQQKRAQAMQPWKQNLRGSILQSVWLHSSFLTLHTQVCDFNKRLQNL